MNFPLVFAKITVMKCLCFFVKKIPFLHHSPFTIQKKRLGTRGKANGGGGRVVKTGDWEGGLLLEKCVCVGGVVSGQIPGPRV